MNPVSSRMGTALVLLASFAFAAGIPARARAAAPLDWKSALRQEPAWYGGAEAVRIADNVLLF